MAQLSQNINNGNSTTAQNSQKKRAGNLFDILVLLLIAYLPFQLALNLRPGIDLMSARILILALFLIWLGLGRARFLASNIQGFGLLVFLAINSLSLVVAQEPGWGLRKLLFFLSIFPLYFVVADFLRQKKAVKNLLWVVFAVSALVAAVGIFQFISQFLFGPSLVTSFYINNIGPLFWGQSFSVLVSDYPSWFVNINGQTLLRAFGLLPDPHMMAFFIGLILPISFSLLLAGGRRMALLLAVNFLLFVVLLLTFSRGGYLGIIAAIGGVLFFYLKAMAKNRKLLILLSFVLIIFFMFLFGQLSAGRLISSFSLSEGSSLGRLEIWRDSLAVFWDHPLLGVGLGNYPLEVDPFLAYRSPVNSHNLYLDILAETGIFGLLAWLFLIFGSLWQLTKRIKQEKTQRPNNFEAPLAIGLAGSLVYFAIHSIFETPVFSPVILPFLMIIFGLISFIVYNKNHGNIN